MLDSKCSVTLNNEIAESDEFVAFIVRPDGDVGLFYKTDALTMGMAMQMCIKEFAILMEQCSEEEQKEIHAVLGGQAEDLSDDEIQIEIEMENSEYEEY